MAIKPIQWDELSYSEQLALAAAGEQSPLAFTALWFNITQGDSFRTNWHHHYFNWAAEKVLSGEVKNLIVNIPPGGTKTEFWSVHLPVYCMVKFPRVRILNTSYSKDLVGENSERSRALVKSSEFQQFYSFDIGKDKVDDWTIEKEGKRVHQLFSRPSGGQITGVRGGYMSDTFSGYINADDWDKIDDLFSETKRKKSHTRIVNTLRSRKADFNTPFIFVQQRGHVDDSTAYLLSGSMGLEIDLHIKIPALIDQDYIDSLPPGIKERCIRDVCSHKQLNGKWSYWPVKESVDDLTALKIANPYTFASQYDQDPEKLDGGIFFESDFEYYGSVEDGADMPQPECWEYRIITVDTAQKTGEANDWTVYTEWGVYHGCIYRLRSFRKRVTAKELRQTFKSFVQACWEDNSPGNGNLRAILVEDKSSGTGLIQEMTNQLPLRITPLPRTKDKLTRAMDCQPHVGSKKVKLRYGDPTNLDFVPEVCSFKEDDSHPFDDQTDTMMDAVDYVCIQPFTKAKAFVMKRSR